MKVRLCLVRLGLGLGLVRLREGWVRFGEVRVRLGQNRLDQ